jgi:hypothetical protein
VERALPLSAHDRVVEVTLLSEPEAKADDEDGGEPEGSPPVSVAGEEESLTSPLSPDDETDRAASADGADESPGIVNRVVDQVTGAAAKVLDLFT